MTPHQAYTLWDAVFGHECNGGKFRSRNEAAQLAYAAVFSSNPSWKLVELPYLGQKQVIDLLPERRTAPDHFHRCIRNSAIHLYL